MVSTAASSSSSSSLPSSSNSSNSTSEIVIPTVKTDDLYYSVAILYNKDVKATFSVEYV